MTEIIKPGAGILFMKVGAHAREPLSDIIKRKKREIEETGYALWGYGGNTCHPRTMVQPFGRMCAERGQPIFLCMEEMDSSHFAEQLRAGEMSIDGINWEKIPATVNVLGSRFALKIGSLREEEHVLPLAQTRVAVGNARGRLGARYIQGRVDKACLEVMNEPERVNEREAQRTTKISLVAELVDPYAVFLRDHG